MLTCLHIIHSLATLLGTPVKSDAIQHIQLLQEYDFLVFVESVRKGGWWS